MTAALPEDGEEAGDDATASLAAFLGGLAVGIAAGQAGGDTPAEPVSSGSESEGGGDSLEEAGVYCGGLLEA